MRKLLVLSGIAVVALLAIAVTYLTLIDVNVFRSQIQAAIQKQLGRPVSLGTMALRIVPLSIRIANVSIAEDPTFKTGLRFASASEVSVAVRLFPLLRKQLHVDSFVLREPAIELVRDGAGKWNFASLGGDAGGEGGGGLSIAELRVENGRVAVSELGKRRSVYEHINISLMEFAPGRPFRLKLAATPPSGSNESLRLEAAGGPLDLPQPPFKGRIEFRQVAFSALRQFLSASATQADGIIDGTVDFELKNSVMSARPRLAIDRIRVSGKDLGQGFRIEGDVQHDLNSGVLRTSGLHLTAGQVPVVMSGEVDTRKSRIDLKARTNGAPIAGLLGAAAALGGAGISGSGVLDLDARIRGPLDRVSELEYFGQGLLRDAKLNLPSLTQPLQVRSANLKLAGTAAGVDGLVCSLGSSTLRGGVTVRNFVAPAADFDFEIDQLDIAELQRLTPTSSTGSRKGSSTASTNTPTAKGNLRVGTLSFNDVVLKQVRSECSFAGGLLTLAPLTAQVFNGTQTGGITVDLRSEPAAVAVKTKLEAVDANQLLSATTSLKQALYGLLAASGDASMKLLPGANGTRTLNGNLGISLTKGRLGGINLMNEMANLGRFVGFANNAQPFTDVVSLTGDIQVRDGVARSDNLLVRMDGGSVAGSGSVNLADETLNLRLTAILGRETSQKVGGSRVGGYLTTVLVNNQGELVIPAVVTGTFAKPHFAPDAARVAEMKLKTVLPSVGNKGAVASGVVGLIKGEKGAGKSILQSITGRQGEAGQGPSATAPGTAPAGQEPSAAAPGTAPTRKGLLGVLENLQKKTQQPASPQPGTPR